MHQPWRRIAYSCRNRQPTNPAQLVKTAMQWAGSPHFEVNGEYFIPTAPHAKEFHVLPRLPDSTAGLTLGVAGGPSSRGHLSTCACPRLPGLQFCHPEVPPRTGRDSVSSPPTLAESELFAGPGFKSGRALPDFPRPLPPYLSTFCEPRHMMFRRSPSLDRPVSSGLLFSGSDSD